MSTRLLRHATFERVDDREFDFTLDARIENPASFKIAFVILLDGDLVMSPEHLGVASMVAVLRRAGFGARIFEVEHGDERRAVEALAAYGPLMTCFTLMSLNVPSCMRFCSLLRERCPETCVVCGGPAGTYATEEVLRQIPEADAVAIGEGEPTIFDLVQRLCLGEDFSTCPGICYRLPDGSVKRNPGRRLLHDLDVLPFAARDQLEAHGNRLEYIRVSTSRGCVARCTFCSAPNVSNMVQVGKAWRARSPESVVRELRELHGRYGFKTFDFIDSTFEDPDGGRIGKSRIAAIANGILESGLDIYYNCCMRAENWSDDDRELVELLVRSGLEKVNVGIESGTPSELVLWDKLATVDDNVRMLRLLRQHGIYLAMGFIQFHPYSTVDTLTSNAAFLKDNHCAHNLRRLTERLEIYPGTRIVERLERDGLLDEDYARTLNPFGYRFKDERVARLAGHFASLYNNDDYHELGVITEQSAVFEFETFNVVLETFCIRTRRRFGHLPAVAEELDRLTATIRRVRGRIAAFNYDFFTENVSAVLHDRFDPADRPRHVAEIEALFRAGMDEIRRLQMQIGKRLLRAGIDLAQIGSVVVPARDGGAPRSYSGGAPCW